MSTGLVPPPPSIAIAMMMSPVSPNDNGFVPLTLKGELMDLEFTVDTDHRKRRRNRTTQSCLNCHTSKRKCDRKRPCQRCIQLGLTGLCVYEIDDPALRDDPSIDENQRLKNRIAELESLVRELRGKPHPRWAESSFRDGDPNEKWHSRATKCAPIQTKRTSSNEDASLLAGLSPITRNNSSSTAASLANGAPPRNGGMLVGGIKTEDPSNGVGMHGVGGSPQLYRFSPSPQPGQRGPFQPFAGAQQQHQHPIDVRSDGSGGSGGYDDGERGSNGAGGRSPYTYGAAAIVAGGANNSGHYSDGGGGGGGGGGGSDDGYHGSPHTYGAGGSNGSNGAEGGHSTCGCRANPAVHLAYMALASNLQSALQTLRQFHGGGAAGAHACPAYRKALELGAVLGDQDSPHILSGAGAFDGSGPSSDAGDIMTPLSASSAGLSPSALHHPHHLPHHHLQQQQQQQQQQQHAQPQHSPHVQHTAHPHPHPQQHPHSHPHAHQQHQQQHQQHQHHPHPHSHPQPHPHRQSHSHLVDGPSNGNDSVDDEWHHQMAHAAGFSPYFSTPGVYSVGHVMS